jgi:hypothetical protein
MPRTPNVLQLLIIKAASSKNRHCQAVPWQWHFLLEAVGSWMQLVLVGSLPGSALLHRVPH